MGVTVQDDYNLGAEDLTSDSKKTRFLHGHLKIDEGGGDILNDSSGNGRGLTWNTSGTNATAADAGVWTVNGLEYGSSTASFDCFVASNKEDYNLGDNSKTWICVVQFIIKIAPAANTSLFSGRGGVGGNTDAGHTFYMNSSFGTAAALHNGTSSLANKTSGVGNLGTVDELYTSAFCLDASEGANGSIKLINAGGSTNVQYHETTFNAITALNDTSTSDDFTCIGQRSGLQNSELTKDVVIKNVRCYCDPDGGALPNNLPDIIRWLHQNPTANIPSKWWS